MKDPTSVAHKKTPDLPIWEVAEETNNCLKNQNTLILQASPGAGKSTILPLVYMHEDWLAGKKIIMLEPRRLAAKTIAARMSSLIDEKVGKSIGHRVRYDTKIGTDTQVEVVTEGILTRMIQNDNGLEGVGMVIFDEFHERSLHADIAMALCRETQQVLRPDLRILVMSATLDMTKLSLLLEAPVIQSQGKQHPVTINYTGDTDETLLPELTAQTVNNAAKENDGDILVFLPGQREIRKCEELLKRKLSNFNIHPLYGQLPHKEQQAAILPNREGKRKVVLATSIAETSLTIEGVKVVVDTGFGRTSRFDPRSGLSRLETILISKDSADQRAGRAGRLGPGTCYRMWSKTTESRMTAHRTPEIMEADLASLVLDLAQWGIIDPGQLLWLTPPPKGALAQAVDVLEQLQCLQNGKITSHGKEVHKLPCHPRIAHMLLSARQHGNLSLATDIAALLEERDPLPKEKGIDINIRIETLRRYRNNKSSGGRFAMIEKAASSYRDMLRIDVSNKPFNPYETGFLLVNAYPERIACARPGNNAQFQLANGRIASASHRDELAHDPWLAVAHVDARDGMGRIFMASPLNPKDLIPLLQEQEIITWDTEDGGLIANLELRIGSILLKSEPLPNPDKNHLVQAISDAIKKEGENLLSFTKEVQDWQNRVMSLRKWNPQSNWPDVSTKTLLLTNSDWLAPYLNQIKRPEDLKRLNLLEILQNSLSWEHQQELNRLAPLKITVPSGSQIKIDYHKLGEQPVLAVRLQELFGLKTTPTINNGKTSLLIHLLSPGFKPVQVTSDLESFWNNTYFEVKKELKRRYPKHAWPEDPHGAQAIRGVRKKDRK